MTAPVIASRVSRDTSTRVAANALPIAVSIRILSKSTTAPLRFLIRSIAMLLLPDRSPGCPVSSPIYCVLKCAVTHIMDKKRVPCLWWAGIITTVQKSVKRYPRVKKLI